MRGAFLLFAPAVAAAFALTVADTCSVRLLVLDTLLPGQRLCCDTAPESFASLVQDRKEPLVCVGRNQLSLHWVGCEATASWDESGSIILSASDRLAQIENDYSDDGGSKWNGRAGSVTWLGRLSEQDNLLSIDDSYSLAKALEHGSNLGLEVSPERLVPWQERQGADPGICEPRRRRRRGAVAAARTGAGGTQCTGHLCRRAAQPHRSNQRRLSLHSTGRDDGALDGQSPGVRGARIAGCD